MDKPNQPHTFGLWSVKPGKENEFVAAWENFAMWTMKNQPGASGEAKLLRYADQPGRFLSIGAWDSASKIQEWRQRPEFKTFLTKAKELCDHVEPHTVELVSLVGR